MKKITLLAILTALIGIAQTTAQDANQTIEKINAAVNQHEQLHFKTSLIFKYYSRPDTTFATSETWLSKTAADTILGMNIRSASQTKFAEYNNTNETLHKGTQTWLVNHNNDTTTLFDISKGHWDGYHGNTKTDYTIDCPLVIGIHPDSTDSVAVTTLDNGDLEVSVYMEDALEYGITNILTKYWINSTSMLPYRQMHRWNMGDRLTYKLLDIELISTDKNTVEQGINKPLPNYPIVKYISPDKAKFAPHPIGTPTPELKGYMLTDSSEFDLATVDKKVIMIDFWYQTCAPCIKAVPYLDSLQHEFGDQGFVVYGINSRDHKTSSEVLTKFLESRGGKVDHVVMTDLKTETKGWQSYGNPTFYLIKDGKIVWMRQGFAKELYAEMKAKVAELLAD